MAKTDPAAISSTKFFDRARARLDFEIPAGLTDPDFDPCQWRSGHRPHARDPRARTADPSRGGTDCGHRSSAADGVADATLGPSQRPRRPDFLSWRQDRSDGRIATRRGVARGGRGSRPCTRIRRSHRLPRSLRNELRLSHPADGGAGQAGLRIAHQSSGSRRCLRGPAGVSDESGEPSASQQGIPWRGTRLLRHALWRALYLGRDCRNPSRAVPNGYLQS